MSTKRPALGRGLSALIPEAPPARETRLEVDIDLLSPNKHQPRGPSDAAKLEELARSIKTNGIIQPIIVRKVDGAYHIVAGERRWRAAQRAGLMRVPVIVSDVPDEKLLEVALVENIQREDLNPIEEATAYKKLADEFHLTQEAIAEAVGKDRSSIANHLRLLKLPHEVRADVAAGSLTMGHARTLLGLADEAAQRRAAREIVSRGLSVRDTEALVRKLAAEPGGQARHQVAPADVHTRAAEERLRLALGTRVRIIRHGARGRIEIDFASEDELQRLFEQLTG